MEGKGEGGLREKSKLVQAIACFYNNSKQVYDKLTHKFGETRVGKKVMWAFKQENTDWMFNGAYALTIGAMVKNYKKNHDVRTYRRMFKELSENGANFCESVSKRDVAEDVCSYSKLFYDKSFMKTFCRNRGFGPNLSVKIKKNGDIFHKGYCACSYLAESPKETLINPN